MVTQPFHPEDLSDEELAAIANAIGVIERTTAGQALVDAVVRERARRQQAEFTADGVKWSPADGAPDWGAAAK